MPMDGGLECESLIKKAFGGVSVAQSCLTLCDPMDCSPPGSFVHGILWARILEWVAPMQWSGSLLQRTFPTQGLNLGLLHCRRILCYLRYQGL